LDAQDGQVVAQPVMDVTRQADPFFSDRQLSFFLLGSFQFDVGSLELLEKAFCPLGLFGIPVDQDGQE
jgi:hypothetical protein